MGIYKKESGTLRGTVVPSDPNIAFCGLPIQVTTDWLDAQQKDDDGLVPTPNDPNEAGLYYPVQRDDCTDDEVHHSDGCKCGVAPDDLWELDSIAGY